MSISGLQTATSESPSSLLTVYKVEEQIKTFLVCPTYQGREECDMWVYVFLKNVASVICNSSWEFSITIGTEIILSLLTLGKGGQPPHQGTCQTTSG